MHPDRNLGCWLGQSEVFYWLVGSFRAVAGLNLSFESPNRPWSGWSDRLPIGISWGARVARTYQP
ncbi:MAG: hypothetical protein EA001_01665 [Oscillatoriales cyanobacterium]|nr:MAG: hypothetical protein EA001_01665 [Oscillatoriales cyanobacterium]